MSVPSPTTTHRASLPAEDHVGSDPRARVGVPIAGALILYLRTRRVREYFEGAR